MDLDSSNRRSRVYEKVVDSSDDLSQPAGLSSSENPFQPHDLSPYDEEDAKKVLRKIDWRLMPLLAITYGMQFIDKTTLGLAANYGLIQDLNLQGAQYSWLGSAFYISYLIFEFPMVSMMQKFPVAKFVSVNIILWGIILVCHAAATSFTGLLVCRLLLGVLECTISPGSNIITGRFYTKKELPLRISAWVSFNGLGNVVGGFIGYAIGLIQGPLPVWKYVFLIAGASATLWGVVLYFFLESSPSDAKFLNEKEQKIAVARVASNNTGLSVDRKLRKYQIADAFTDPQIIIILLISIATNLPNGGITNFLTLVVRGLGFSPVKTVLVQLPVGAIQFILTIIGGWMLSSIPRGRLYVSIFWLIPCVICSTLLCALPRSDTIGLLISTYFLTPYIITMIAVMALLNINVAGTTKKSTANAVYFIGYSLGNICGPFFFLEEQAPVYTLGCVMMIVGFVSSMILLALLRLHYQYQNSKRLSRLDLRGVTYEESSYKESAEELGFQDKTDRENPFFLYSI